MIGKMNCLEEKEIERLVLGSDRMWEDEREHLFGCDRCRERFLALTAVYAPLLGETSAPGGAVESSSFEEKIIVLLPLYRENGESSVFRLAAKGGQPDDSVTVLSFSGNEHGFIGRLLRDAHGGNLSFYLLADDMQQVQGVQVLLPDASLQGITDLQGRADFGEQELPSCSWVQVVTPRATLILQPFDPSFEKNREHHAFTLKNIEESDIEITITRESAQGRYQLLFRRVDGQPALRELKVVAVTDLRTLETATERGVAVVQTQAPERLLKIHIY